MGYEHAIFVSKMIGVNPSDCIGLVTSRWHLSRALKEFRKEFKFVIPVPVGKSGELPSGFIAWLPNAAALSKSTAMIKEYVGMIWYCILHSYKKIF